jgi:HEAT repeats
VKRRVVRIGLGVIIGLGVLAGAVLILVHTLGERDQIFEGKPIYLWSAQLQSKDPALSNAACLVLNRAIIPQLTRDMVQDTNDSHLRIALIEYLNTLPNVNIFYRRSETRRADAASTLGEFGQAAIAATPALLQAVQGRDTFLRPAAASALGKIHADPATAIPLLIKYLDDDNVNEAAARGLAGYGPAAKAAVPKLLQLSKVPDKDLHHAVMQALSKIDPESAAKAEGKNP